MRKVSNSSSMLDLFLLLAMGFVVLFVLAFILIKPVNPKDKDIELDEQLLIKLEWEDASKADVDLWIMLPDGRVVSFKSKEQGVATLERDDRGTYTDLVLVNGETMPVYDNTEVARIKQLEDGEYYISVQYYTNSLCQKCDKEAYKVSIHDGVKHRDLAIFTGVVYRYGETPVARLVVENGAITTYELSTRYIAVESK